MVRTKRKRIGAEAGATVETIVSESPPPKKRARRVAKQTTIPIIDVQDSDASDAVQVRKRRKTKSKLTEPEPAPSPKARKKKKNEHLPTPTPPPMTQEGSDSDDASDAVVSPQKRRIRRKVEVQSDSDEVQDEAPKRLRRVKSSTVDAENDSLADSPHRGRLRRKSEEEEEDVKGSMLLDSDDDPEDLALPVQPTSSKPSKKELMSSALQRYAKRRNKSSPAPIPEDAADEVEEREFALFSDAEEDEPDDAADGEEAEDTFIVDEDEGDADADANAALDRMRYSSRQLDEHFAVFVEYIIALHSDPDYLSTATEDEKEYFGTAVNALKRHIDPLADSMTLSTWKAPFIATLNLRPILADGLSCEPTGDCHACWTRGMYACDTSEAYTISTAKGIYDHNTFLDIPEKKIKYGKATQFENNAEARNLPYPPRFQLVIGKRCFNRALAYHDARHYMYGVSVRVKEKINSLSEGNEELANDPNALLEAMKEESFIEYLWGRFKSDKKQWAQFANRKDDALV
ncbi:hypothetical protein B0H19DRAFT_1163158 [Mycena capillaripes]|nr:hypothetical protein B0H19DRAFT_1163158 [Mycena capillaripes]